MDFASTQKQYYHPRYNKMGSLVSDAGRKIAHIDYDNMNNPVRIQFIDENVTKYIYSATGEKLRVIYITAVPNISVPIGCIKELSPSEILCKDSTDYLLGGNLTLRNGRIDKYQFEEGYCQADANSSTKDQFTFCYYDQDHLGSVRQVTEADGSKNGYVIQTANYYPFGGELCQGDAKNSVQPYKYNGKEFDNMYGLNTYDYGARQYNPVTGRWDRMDQLCEKYYPTSPFAYCVNNPVRFIDPDGKVVKIWYTDRRGRQQLFVFSGFHGQRRITIPNNQFVNDVIRVYVYNTSNGGGLAMKKAVHSKKSFYVDDARTENEGADGYEKKGSNPNVQPTVYWNPETGLEFDNNKRISPATCLEHEFGHAVNEATDQAGYNKRSMQGDSKYTNKEEKNVITGPEAITARANGEDVRHHHRGHAYKTINPTSTRKKRRK